MKGKMPQNSFHSFNKYFFLCLALFAKKKQIAKYSTSLNLMELSFFFLFFFFSGETIVFIVYIVFIELFFSGESIKKYTD